MQASWIDSDELRALATALQEPMEEIHEELWIPEPLLNETFITHVTLPTVAASYLHVEAPISEPTSELQALHEKLRIIREEALTSGLLPIDKEEPPETLEDPVKMQETAPVSAPTIVAPSFLQGPELTEMSQRLTNLHRFVVESTSCQEMLILNKEGDLLWGTSQHYDIMATIMIATRYHNHDVFEATLFKLTNLDDTLMVLSTPTRHGQIFLALINAVNTDEPLLQSLGNAMITAIEG